MILILNHATSVSLITVCWWLAHQNAVRPEPFARTISCGYAITGIMLAGIAFGRQIGFDIAAMQAGVKAALTFTLGMVCWRLQILDAIDRERGSHGL